MDRFAERSSCCWYVIGQLTLGLGILVMSACSPRFSPWDINLEDRHQNLTEKHLNWLNSREQGDLPLTFAIIGDPQGTPGDFRATIQKINRLEEVAFILVLGDMTDHGLKHEYLWAADAIAESIHPVLTVIGNHDAISHGKVLYQKMFGPFDYTFNYAGLKFIMWNNNLLEFGQTNFPWLAHELDERSVVASHIPPTLDIHNESQLNEWHEINHDAKIISSLHGHRGGINSFYWQVKDIPYYVVARTRGVRYSLVNIDESYRVHYQSCHDETCTPDPIPTP